MLPKTTRRRFLAQAGAVAASTALPIDEWLVAAAEPDKPGARVAIARDDALTQGQISEHRDLLKRLLDASVQKITQSPSARAAWRKLFNPSERIGIKVNSLGFATQPVVVDAIVAGLRDEVGVPAENIIVWDRLDEELVHVGFKLNKSNSGVRCRGTDAKKIGSGYQRKVEGSGEIKSRFSHILAEEVDAMISVPVLKDHSLAGVSLGMKNFYGAFHNPNRYHANNCDPFIVDVVSHRFIKPKWRLTVCDGTRGQYNGGPLHRPQFVWPFGGLIVGTDFVATDAVAADFLHAKRREMGLRSVAEENRPAKHIATAGARGLGVADLNKIEQIIV